ncbi:MAG: hypothetical protein DMF11_13525 [Verrucomicrobia bacterium]|nr:MAG: hypothetical protein DMF11_13525 [Verrucomicrobiota bacterium]
MFVVSGASTFLSAALGEAAEPAKGLPPPNIHNLALQSTAPPGTLMGVGILARCVQVSVAML